jgi:hypothetical protein
MAKETKLLDVFERNKYDLHSAARKSRSWFDQQISLLDRQALTPQKVLNSNPEQVVSQIIPGNLYMYFYDPKTKAELPYYDRFPLVFPFTATTDGFYGLNMHYLPYQLRVVLLDRLMVFKSNSRLDETTKLKYAWATVNGLSKFAAVQPCVKQYLYAHVRSKFRRISSSDWATAMMLPVERFIGASKEAVWTESNKIIRRF